MSLVMKKPLQRKGSLLSWAWKSFWLVSAPIKNSLPYEWSNRGLSSCHGNIADRVEVRMMRILVSIGIFSEAGEEEYRHNRRSIALKHPTFCTFASGL
jgi:hypothetical protein